MPLMGITEGLQPIIGYNYGAKLMKRVRKTLLYGIIIGSTFSSLTFLIMFFNADSFVGIFLNEGSPTIAMASNGLKIYIAMLPLLSVNLMGIAYFQSTAQGRISMVLGMLRQFIILMPLLMVLPGFLGLNGIWLAVPISDGLSILVVGIALLRSFRSTNGVSNQLKTI